LPDEEVEEMLTANADLLADKYPQHSPSVLRALVQETRAKGYAVNPGMLLSDSWGIGVAVRGHDGRPIGALSIAAIESRLGEERQRELAQLLTKEARWIQTRLSEVGGLKTQSQRRM
jgi:DNA-binding IclR family transcriptional regulator